MKMRASHLPLLLLAAATTVSVAAEFLSFETPSFKLKLDKDSQTLASLIPKSVQGGSFDFSPFDVLTNRSRNGNHHVGDILFRARTIGSSSGWTSADSASTRSPVVAKKLNSPALAAADLTPTLPKGALLKVTRLWTVEDGELVLKFNISNAVSEKVEIGTLGFAVEFNNILTDRTSEDMYANCSFVDPAISQDGGYLHVTRINGAGPALVVTPVGKTPLEAWKFLEEDQDTWPYYQSQTFEGLYEWTVFTKAYAEQDWKGAKPWNVPTSKILQAGESFQVGLRFSLAPEIRNIESVLEKVGNSVVMGVPGYVIPNDMTGKLFIKYAKAVEKIEQEPANSFDIVATADAKNGWTGYNLKPKPQTWGRVRLSIKFVDGKLQTVNYYTTKSAPQALADMGDFLFTKQWFDDKSDPFDRAPSIITYDRSKNAQVLQDPRVWIPGLSDEGGAGSWLAAAMKTYVQPKKSEVQKLEEFIQKTVWGGLQYSNGTNKYGVRLHMFFYEPAQVPGYKYDKSIDWKDWWSWNKTHSLQITRAYNYVHVIAAYWALYRTAKTHPTLVTTHTKEWYLDQAVQTILFMTKSPHQVSFWDLGLMGETVIMYVLEDLKREGNKLAAEVEGRMKERAEIWHKTEIPFGSEMAWDSTGQEGVYLWTKYFGFNSSAEKTLGSILGYTPSIPHWGWNGNSRRYWDNIYGGKLRGIERQIHHYGSALNSLPLLSNFRSNPTDFYTLLVGHAGNTAPLTNIDTSGFGSASFHSFPRTLAWDSYSGDYGPGFLGMALGTGCYIINHQDLGWVSFAGDIEVSGSSVVVKPRDALRRRVFVASFGVFLELDAGAFDSVTVDTKGNKLSVTILAAVAGGYGEAAVEAGLEITKTAEVGAVGNFNPKGLKKRKDGLWKVTLGKEGMVVVDIVGE